MLKSRLLRSLAFAAPSACLATAVGLLLALAPPLAAPASAQLFSPPSKRLVVDGVTRRYYLHIPKQVQQGSVQVPLILVLHGAGGHAWRMDRHTGFDKLADEKGFIVVYPVGRNRRWNDGRVGRSGADDLRFLPKLVDHLVATTAKVDRRRVYITGMSNGGFMSLRLACERPDVFAGVAAVLAQFTYWHLRRCRPDRPISVMVMNGTRDPLVPYRGGDLGPQILREAVAIGTEPTVRFWVKHNRCQAPEVATLPDRVRSDGGRVRRTLWQRCRGGARVALYRVEGAGHTWPGGWQYVPSLLVGRTNRDIDGSRHIWRFFMGSAPRR